MNQLFVNLAAIDSVEWMMGIAAALVAGGIGGVVVIYGKVQAIIKGLSGIGHALSRVEAKIDRVDGRLSDAEKSIAVLEDFRNRAEKHMEDCG